MKWQRSFIKAVLSAFSLVSILFLSPLYSFGLASNNIPLDSPVYIYLEKLSGFGIIASDIQGLKPFSKSEAARLVLEAERNISRLASEDSALAVDVIQRLKDVLPREISLHDNEHEAPVFDWNPLSRIRLRYVYLDGEPRDYKRPVNNPGGEGLFGIGHFGRNFGKGNLAQAAGTEGTPLLENNEGLNYQSGHNLEIKSGIELFFTKNFSAFAEPVVQLKPGIKGYMLNKAYIKVGGKGLELEVGRDENRFGQGFRGTTVLSNNARNLDFIKLSSPEPVGWKWIKEYIGDVKYSLLFSRLSPSGAGENYRHPYFLAFKLAVKPTPDFEIGANFTRQLGGPNASVSGNLFGAIFGGEYRDGSNSLGGIDVRWRFPWLRGTTVYWEYMGEDNQAIVPYVESHLVGIFIPRLTSNGKNDLRFEYYSGNKVAYADYQFPEGYTNKGMVLGHPQGGDTKEYFTRFTHYFSARNILSLEYFHTQRGRLGRTGTQAVEEKNAGRILWNLPVHGDWDILLNYGFEHVKNFDLLKGTSRNNHILRIDIRFMY